MATWETMEDSPVVCLLKCEIRTMSINEASAVSAVANTLFDCHYLPGIYACELTIKKGFRSQKNVLRVPIFAAT